MGSVKPTKSSEIDQVKTYKFFIYGPSGSGKTTIACTAPNPIFALTEVGRSSRRIDGMSRATGKDILVSQISSKGDLMKFCEIMSRKTDKVYTCILDTISDLQSIITSELVAMKDEKYRDNPDLYQLTQPDYGYIGRSLESVMREFSSLPHNVVILCHQKEYPIKRGIEETRRIVPSLQGDTIPTAVGRMFHAVGYSFFRVVNGEPKYYVSFASDDILTKIDDGLRPIETPNVSKWIERMTKCAENSEFKYSDSDDDTSDVKQITGKEAGVIVTKKKAENSK